MWLLIIIIILLGVTWLKLLYKSKSPTNISKLSINLPLLTKLRLSKIFSQAYQECRQRNLPIAKVQLFCKPVIFIADPDLVKEMVRNWSNFRNRGSYHNNCVNAENLHLFNMKDGQWDIARKLLGKYFTTEKLKTALDVFDTYTKASINNLGTQEQLQNVDIFEVTHEFAFSVTSHMFLAQKPQSTNTNFSMKDFERLYNPGLFNRIVDVFGYICPWLLRWFNVCDIPEDVFQSLKSMLLEVLHPKSTCLVDHRLTKDSLCYQLLHDSTEPQNIEQIIGFMIGLIVGSLKSTTTFAAYACYELAKSPHVQRKLYEEICILRDQEDNLSYASLSKMTYMKKVLNETLRLHSGGPLLIRECNKDAYLNLIDGTTVKIAKGNLVFASLQAILKDDRYFPEPMAFNPDRFDQSQNYFWPFGIGKHTCIGNKFVMLQVQIFLIRLLSAYELSMSQKCEASFVDSQHTRLVDGMLHLEFRLRH